MGRPGGDRRACRACSPRLPALAGVEAHAASGDAVEQLERHERSVDLLVIGGHRYRPLDRLLQDSTAEQLADRARRPLLVLAARSRA